MNGPVDTWLPLRKAWVAHLKAFAPLTALVAAARIYGEQPPATPTWPFIRIGPQSSVPWQASGYDGAAHRLSTHCFANGPHTDAVANIAAAVVEASNSFVMPDNLNTTELEWRQTTTLPDEEASKWHAVVEIDATITLRD